MTLYVTARGLMTSPIPYDGETFEILFDLIEHDLLIQQNERNGQDAAPRGEIGGLRLANNAPRYTHNTLQNSFCRKTNDKIRYVYEIFFDMTLRPVNVRALGSPSETGLGGLLQRRSLARHRFGSRRRSCRPRDAAPRASRSTLHLKGVSTGDFEEALMALVGTDAGGLSASTIARLKEIWAEEHARWQQRDLSAKRYVYLWADGVYF
jgi:hypothetical protein